jgi:thiamine pyrophosphokinase
MSTETPVNNPERGKCILVGAGDLTISDIPVEEKDLCIAVDGGYEYCKLFGIEPDYFIGDMDSLGEEAAKELAESVQKGEKPDSTGDSPASGNKEDRVILLPTEKDETDMLAAINLGLSEGFREFTIYAGIGGRLEHTIANIQCLLYLKEHQATGYLMDGTGMILAAKEETVSFQEKLEGYLSLFSMGDKALVSIKNMKYELDHAAVTNSFPLGISNEFIGKKGSITVHQGSVVIILSW